MSITGPSTSRFSSTEDNSQVKAEKRHKKMMAKSGFDQLQLVVPSLAVLPTMKISKAAQLNKTADFITQLQEMLRVSKTLNFVLMQVLYCSRSGVHIEFPVSYWFSSGVRLRIPVLYWCCAGVIS